MDQGMPLCSGYRHLIHTDLTRALIFFLPMNRSTPIASYESLPTPNKETKLPLKLSANPSDLDKELELVSDTNVLVGVSFWLLP